MNIFTKLKTTGGLTKSEKQIAEFILKDPVRFLSLSTDKICKECYVSAPTIYRLCTKLNIDGLSDLKVHISASIDDYITGNEEFDFNYPVKQNQTYYEVGSIYAVEGITSPDGRVFGKMCHSERRES